MTRTTARPLGQSLLRPVAVTLAGIAALTISSYVALPMYPVPVTLQTLVVLLLGAVAGPRLGAGIVLAWMGLALAGAPVLANGASGLIAFTGATAGYLFAFPVAAFLAGFLPKRHNLSGLGLRFAGFLALHGLILAAGGGWLATLSTPETAWATGVLPFLAGSLLKSALATAVMAAMPGAKA